MSATERLNMKIQTLIMRGLDATDAKREAERQIAREDTERTN